MGVVPGGEMEERSRKSGAYVDKERVEGGRHCLQCKEIKGVEAGTRTWI